jgi:hypothetical protein
LPIADDSAEHLEMARYFCIDQLINSQMLDPAGGLFCHFTHPRIAKLRNLVCGSTAGFFMARRGKNVAALKNAL